METIDIRMEGEGAFADLSDPLPAHGKILRAAFLPDGTVSGKPTVALGIRLDDGAYVIAETTWALFSVVYTAFHARLGAP